MIGFSRFGQIAAQMLLAGGSRRHHHRPFGRPGAAGGLFGFRIYFGDGTRRDVLEASGIHRAKIVAVCTNKREITDRIVELVQSALSGCEALVRSYDRTHTLQLRARNVDYELRETFESGLLFGQKTLEALGMDESTAALIRDDIRRRDEERLALQAVEGLAAGRDRWLTKPVTPEPLIKPTRESRRIDKAPPVEVARAGAELSGSWPSEQFQEKWKPVLRPELRKNNDMEGSTDSKNGDPL